VVVSHLLLELCGRSHDRGTCFCEQAQLTGLKPTPEVKQEVLQLFIQSIRLEEEAIPIKHLIPTAGALWAAIGFLQGLQARLQRLWRALGVSLNPRLVEFV
jgi:hypothetical protein